MDAIRDAGLRESGHSSVLDRGKQGGVLPEGLEQWVVKGA